MYRVSLTFEGLSNSLFRSLPVGSLWLYTKDHKWHTPCAEAWEQTKFIGGLVLLLPSSLLRLLETLVICLSIKFKELAKQIIPIKPTGLILKQNITIFEKIGTKESDDNTSKLPQLGSKPNCKPKKKAVLLKLIELVKKKLLIMGHLKIMFDLSFKL